MPRDSGDDAAFAAQRAVVAAAAATLARHDPATGEHSDDVVALCAAIAERVGVVGPERSRLLAAAQLHDIGKVTVPRAIIEKSGPLDDREWALIRGHTVAGERIISSVPEMVQVARIVRHSHERYDGRGYPDGLAGEQIPFASRIVFCADAFHAIRCDRPYRPGRSAEEALEEVRGHAGTQFDPFVVDALGEAARELRESRRARSRALSGGARSRRTLALLLALAIAGSALAAVKAPIGSLLPGEEPSPAHPPCASSGQCRPDALGRLAAPFGAVRHSLRRSAGEAKVTGSRPTPRAAASPPRSAAAVSPRAQAAAARSQPTPLVSPVRRVAARPGTRWRPKKSSPVRRRAGRPPSPGRSEEAPGRPTQPGRPTGPEPGRSGEAPGKPDGSGRFGH